MFALIRSAVQFSTLDSSSLLSYGTIRMYEHTQYLQKSAHTQITPQNLLHTLIIFYICIGRRSNGL